MTRTIDLDILQPDDIEFTVTVAGEKLTLRAPGDIPIPTVVRLMQLRKAIRDGGEDDQEELLLSLHAEINGVIRAAMPELDDDIAFTGQQVGVIMAVLLGGAPQDAPEVAVVDALTGGEVPNDDIPLPTESDSRKPSRRPSSASAG